MSDKNLSEEKLKMNNDVNIKIDLKCPELDVLYQRQLIIDTLDKEIEEEKCKEALLKKLELRHEISKTQSIELLKHLKEKSQSYTKFINEANKSVAECHNASIDLSEALEVERKENEEFYDNLCYSMLTNPKETFEIILGRVERNEKLKDNSGYSWEWTLKFNLFARLRMALKLIFG